MPKNSMLPVVTVMALQVASLLSGAVITESVLEYLEELLLMLFKVGICHCSRFSYVYNIYSYLGNLVADILYSFIDKDKI